MSSFRFVFSEVCQKRRHRTGQSVPSVHTKKRAAVPLGTAALFHAGSQRIRFVQILHVVRILAFLFAVCLDLFLNVANCFLVYAVQFEIEKF